MTDAEALAKWREWARVTFGAALEDELISDYELRSIACDFIRRVALEHHITISAASVVEQEK